MINQEQIDVIRKYVPDKYFDQERLIRYLSLHDMVGVEVFEYVAKKIYPGSSNGYDNVLPVIFKESWSYKVPVGEEEKHVKEERFIPETVDTFVRRIPFNFYHEGDDVRIDENGREVLIWKPIAITNLTYAIGDPMSSLYYHRRSPLTLEDAYRKLEYLFYDKGYTIEQIFYYPSTITWTDSSDIYGDWFDYIDMCLQLGWEDLMPEKFYYKYNLAREALGIEPVIFPIMEYDCEAWTRDREQVQFYKRNGNKLEFFGVFPCDENNVPVLRWIAVEIRDAEAIECTEVNELECFMTVTLTPKTVIYAQITERDEVGNELPDVEPKWIQIYAGPQTMSFNYKILKERRQRLGYTQQDVADAVQANIRTYQKWESGETKPDGYYLLRILNWLDVPNLNEAIIYENNECFSKR